MNFNNLQLITEILDVIQQDQFENATAIQEQSIPAILSGRDLIASSQTGSGKTAAFVIPSVQLLQREMPLVSASGKNIRPIRSLVLTPTRELAIQIHNCYKNYTSKLKLTSGVIYGGVSQKPQERILARGIDILIATPGRLVDLQNQGLVDLSEVEIFTLDEADRMLDMGFIHDVKKIMKLMPTEKQTLLFSATMPQSVIKFAATLLKDPNRIQIDPETKAVDTITQRFFAVENSEKRNLFVNIVKKNHIDNAIVFTRTKRGADRLAKSLSNSGIAAASIHGDKSQNARIEALNALKKHKISVLVATDVAARGIDIDHLSYVFNYDLPEMAESYVHRIGRTGRAGREGTAVSFCERKDRDIVRQIERLLGRRIEMHKDLELQPAQAC